MKLYKLTDQDGYTRRGEKNETKWGVGVEHAATGTGGLCTDGVIHAYRHPLLAVLLNPAHANIRAPRLWQAEGGNLVDERADKSGVRTLKTQKEITVPEITSEGRVRFAILVALLVYHAPEFKNWAVNWLTNLDRSCDAAHAAAYAADADAAKVTWQKLLEIAEWAITDAPLPAPVDEVRNEHE